MLLTIDLGNTSLKLGIFENNEQKSFICLDDVHENYYSTLLQFIFKAGLRQDQIDKAILSCVVPKAYDAIFDALIELVGQENIIDVNPKSYYGIKLAMPNPDEVGDDLIVMCAYAYGLYKRELLVVSMGTCSVISHVTKDGEFKHCIIAPGLTKMGETLWKNAAMLPEFDLQFKDSYLADNTIDAMNVGIFKGYVGMMSSLIKGIACELGEKPIIIGCGGLGKKAAPYIKELDTYDPDFVTKGLNYIYEKF